VQGTYVFPTLTGPHFVNSDLSAYKNFVFGESESRKLQFRFTAYNFLNHPVPTFNGQNDPALQLHFDSSGAPVNVGGQPFGHANYKTGARVAQAEVKFTF
jgi:hypothetical protein